MTALVNIFDNNIPQQIGENGHVEYGWSNNTQELIVQLSFQLTRTDNEGVKRLQTVLKNVLTYIKYILKKKSTLSEKQVAKGHLSLLYKMIGHTRDIVDGKGEYTLTYMMIYTWYDFFPQLAFFALKCLVDLGNKDIHQYGSWKDIKYFCSYCRSQGVTMEHPLISQAIRLVNEQLKKDIENMIYNNIANITLAAKWVPREKSSFRWLYQALATDYFKQYIETSTSQETFIKAVLKCKTEYRKLLTTLNKAIDTLQIKQCDKSGSWANINFNNVTSISISKQKKAFLNIKKNGEERYPDSKDRVKCAQNFNTHIQKAIKGEIEIKGKRVGMADFTKQALELINGGSQNEKDLLNSQWRDNSSKTGILGNMIAMVDVSGSMEGLPLEVAIALGIRIAEKSKLGKRVMTFHSKPCWINLEAYSDFVSQVEVIKNAGWGMNTNLYAAFDLILDVIIENKMLSEDVENMVLIILSDMQIDVGDKCDKKVLHDVMVRKYSDAGIRVHGTPYKPPHILFWNLRSKSGFPVLSNEKNVSMMSGFSPALLNLFCDKGIDALKLCTPWYILNHSLDNPRYKIMSDKLDQEIDLS